MIAFHYPPFAGGSGIQRALKFSRYLPDHGWQPVILTATPRAYPQVDNGQIHSAPVNVPIRRAFALDTARHLSIGNSYLRWMALPDRWVSWWPGAVFAGLHVIRKYRPQVIWSTYPIATAHLIGLTLHRLTGIRWIVDFRDPMTDTDPLTGVEYPLDPAIRRVNGWIERLTVKRCIRATFTTAGTLSMYADRYPEIPQSRWAMIENGYDEEEFIAAEGVLVHSGLLYPDARDPIAFFTALAELRRAGRISPINLKIILRASGNEDYYGQRIRENGINDIVFLETSLPYRDALVEMMNADGLLIFQAANCNSQIPAKLYEYLRAHRPIFALTDRSGDTACVLRAQGIDTMAPLDSEEQIAQGLLSFLLRVREGRAPIASYEQVRNYSRNSRTQDLARLLDSSVSE
ncbi:MAG: glycosyltransferase [Acidobacteria bacterium]|nr:MAG: glycosyltransferase [Acidobacteriota bacterium]